MADENLANGTKNTGNEQPEQNAQSEAQQPEKVENTAEQGEKPKEDGDRSTVEQLQKKVDQLERAATVSDLKARFTGVGFAADVSERIASGVVDNDTAVLFEELPKLIKAREDGVRAELLKETPRPSAGALDDKDGENAVAANLGKQEAIRNDESKVILDQYLKN